MVDAILDARGGDRDVRQTYVSSVIDLADRRQRRKTA